MSETGERIKREWLSLHEGTGFEDLYEAEFDRWLASVRAETVRSLEGHLVGTFEDGTYLAPYTNLTAREVREGIWHYYDQLDEETASTDRRDGEHQ